MTRNALIIIDVQNDFCPGGSLAVSRGDEVVPALNLMIEHALRNNWMIVASRDFHPHVTSHFNTHGGIWPPHCIMGTKGAEFHPGLKLPATTIVISKGTEKDEDAYSAFQGKWLTRTLEQILEWNGVDTVYLGGLATDYCVKASAIDAAKLPGKVKTYLLTDASRAVNIKPDDGENAIAEMEAAGVVITTTAEVLNGIAS